jgi:hypothetical protein
VFPVPTGAGTDPYTVFGTVAPLAAVVVLGVPEPPPPQPLAPAAAIRIARRAGWAVRGIAR